MREAKIVTEGEGSRGREKTVYQDGDVDQGDAALLIQPKVEGRRVKGGNQG